ncbi:hypothetical protein DFP72DRAFT_900278 [Ephemerocybe angulata]|uniref:Uncharacterized protein n=1 Tax=Ephemerocybe angulata TaxID=980116 RepID=A0A8H6HYA5_9AGAR|nr:hypothetical protein DFP72DRAFT_900278 [Tulosesus angulatus]
MFKQLSKLTITSQGSRRTMLSSRTPASSRMSFYSTKHNSDTYAKDDADTTTPSDGNVFRVDSSSENVQTPTEPLSGEWSRAGAKSEEYATSDSSYKTKAGDQLQYGGAKAKAPNATGKNEGPDAKGSAGRR